MSLLNRTITRTSTSFLEELHDPAATAAWQTFDRRYRHILVGFARHLGLDEADAADVAQETMLGFLQEYRAGGYSRERGRLRSWLLAMARSRIALAQRRLRRRPASASLDDGPDLPDEASVESLWESQWRRQLLREAMDELRSSTRSEPKTIRAFELLCVHRLSPAQVSQQLEMAVQDVYLAKFRVAQRLRAIVTRLERDEPT